MWLVAEQVSENRISGTRVLGTSYLELYVIDRSIRQMNTYTFLVFVAYDIKIEFYF